MENKLEMTDEDEDLEDDGDRRDAFKAVLEVDGSKLKFLCEGQCDIDKVRVQKNIFHDLQKQFSVEINLRTTLEKESQEHASEDS